MASIMSSYKPLTRAPSKSLNLLVIDLETKAFFGTKEKGNKKWFIK